VAVRLALAWAIGQSPAGAAWVVPELEAVLRDRLDQSRRQAYQEVIQRLGERAEPAAAPGRGGT